MSLRVCGRACVCLCVSVSTLVIMSLRVCLLGVSLFVCRCVRMFACVRVFVCACLCVLCYMSPLALIFLVADIHDIFSITTRYLDSEDDQIDDSALLAVDGYVSDNIRCVLNFVFVCVSLCPDACLCLCVFVCVLFFFFNRKMRKI